MTSPRVKVIGPLRILKMYMKLGQQYKNYKIFTTPLFHNLTKQNCKTLTPKFGLQGKLLAGSFTSS